MKDPNMTLVGGPVQKKISLKIYNVCYPRAWGRGGEGGHNSLDIFIELLVLY